MNTFYHASGTHWPLLRKAVFSRLQGDRELAFEFIREFDPAHDLYLNDHRLDGQPVVPLAVATELIAEAAAQACPEMQVIAVRNLRLLQGVVLDTGTRTVRVVAKPQLGASSSPVSVAVEVTSTGQAPRVHYRATVDLAAQLPETTPPLNLAPMPDGRACPSWRWRSYTGNGCFTAHCFKACHVHLVGLSGIRASLATSSPEHWIAGASAQHWVIDPLMFDSALQLLALWGRQHWDMTALPSGFQSYRRFAARPGLRILCELELTQ